VLGIDPAEDSLGIPREDQADSLFAFLKQAPARGYAAAVFGDTLIVMVEPPCVTLDRMRT
jgi:hypothetical protein